MSAPEYCEAVEHEDRLRRQRSRAVRVVDDHSPLVSLKDTECNFVFEPSIVEGYRYLVREAVCDKIVRIAKLLAETEHLLIIRSAWRSFAHQRRIWEDRVERLQRENPEVHESEIREMASYFIAPETRSMHATGGAVDALIFDVENECVMDFGTNHGLKIDLGRRCYPHHPDIPPQAKKNRNLLIGLFEAEDFVGDPKEFWHFDFGNTWWAVAKNEDRAMYGAIAEYPDPLPGG